MTIEEGIREETARTGNLKTTKGTKEEEEGITEEVIGKKKVLENIQEERDDLEDEI